MRAEDVKIGSRYYHKGLGSSVLITGECPVSERTFSVILDSGNQTWVYPSVLSILGETEPVQVAGTHYANKQHQPFDVMPDWMGEERFKGYLQGCVLKYICRYREKNGVEDLEKAAHYLAKLIEVEKA